MRIRRRPPGQPLAYLLHSDPPAPQPPRGASGDHQDRPAGDKREEEGLHLHPSAAADLGGDRSSAARRPALLPLLPQDGVVERGRGLGAQQQGPADGHRSLENGRHRVLEPVIKAGERLNLSNGGDRLALAIVTTTTTMVAKDGGGGSSKKPRGPGVLLEGSRCSRKNGRGWRCSQPTMVGYALCQYHLGKGRMRSAAAAAAARAAAGQLGRTENGKKAPAAAAAATTTATAAPPKAADVPPASVQHC
ncbi:hypothetical protein GQ55_1G408100 [Panicum hallii var. hallii]|uniref:WRC domain-containing protein n=1 Tax=Panicum hallii var. hallii TaxID=1504633 RepID=A0A2T7FCV0_9POAL|nr:hypothetical protein GQ55_1G408100 [Panicum hallii var. hallii]